MIPELFLNFDMQFGACCSALGRRTVTVTHQYSLTGAKMAAAARPGLLFGLWLRVVGSWSAWCRSELVPGYPL